MLKTASRIVPAIVVSWLLPLVFFQYAWVHTALEKLTAIYIVVMSVRLSSPSSIRSTNLNYLPVRPFANISAHFAAY